MILIISIEKLHSRKADTGKDLSVDHLSKVVSNDSESLMIEIVKVCEYRSLKG